MTFHLLPNPPTLICMKLIRHLVSVVSHSHWHCRSSLTQPLTVPLTLYRMREGCHINLCNHNTCRRISNHRNFCGSCCGGAEDEEEEEASPGITPHDRLLSPFALATRLPPSQQQYSSNNNIHSSASDKRWHIVFRHSATHSGVNPSLVFSVNICQLTRVYKEIEIPLICHKRPAKHNWQDSTKELVAWEEREGFRLWCDSWWLLSEYFGLQPFRDDAKGSFTPGSTFSVSMCKLVLSPWHANPQDMLRDGGN